MTNFFLLNNYHSFIVLLPALSISYYFLIIGYFYISSFLTAYKLPFLITILLIFGVILYTISYHYVPILIRFFILFVYIGFLLYLFIYTWKEIPMSLLSFCLFFCNYLIFLSYTSGIYYLLFKGLPSPIYFENLTTYSFYRYTLFLSFIFLACFFYLIIYLFNFNLEKMELLPPFSLRGEINKIVEVWGPSFFHNFFYNISRSIDKSFKFRLILGSFHFCLFYLFRLVNVLLFFNFSFFHGDLRYIIYLLPLSFLVWLLGFLDYSFKWFFNENFEYCKKIFIIRPKKPINTTTYFLATCYDFTYELTPFGEQEGYTTRSKVYAAIESFFEMSNTEYFLRTYQESLLPISIITITLRIICWLYLVNFFLFYHSEFIAATWSGLFSRVSFRGVSQRTYATTAYHINKHHQPLLEKETDGAYKAGHMVAVDTAITDDNGNYLFEGTLTHGPGSANNPSFKVSETNDLSGPHPKGQSLVPPKSPSSVNPSSLGKEIPGSQNFFERSDVKENIAKNTYKDWGDKNT